MDREDLLPASTLKGLMRASAERLLLPHRPHMVHAVFGAPRRPSPWHWSPARFGRVIDGGFRPAESLNSEGDSDGSPKIVRRARVSPDLAAGAALKDHLVIGEEVSAEAAQFSVERYGPLPTEPDGGPWHGLDERGHLAVLACAAAGLHELGSDRRRGLGWVSCIPSEPGLDTTTLDLFDRIAAGEAL